MAWVRIDDHAPEHPKLLKAGPVAGWLWVCGLAYCSRHLTDGHVPAEAITTMGVPKAQDAVARLLSAGLWEETALGYRVHDYHEYQPSKDQVRTRRERTTERVENWKKRRGYAHDNAVSNAVSNDVGNAVSNPAPVPVPVPVPQVPTKYKNSGSAAPPVENSVENSDPPEPDPPAGKPAPPATGRKSDASNAPPVTAGFTSTRDLAPFAVVSALVRACLQEGRDYSYAGGEGDLVEELKTRCAKAKLGYDAELVRKALDSERVKAQRARRAS